MPTDEELRQREAALAVKIKNLSPEFVRPCKSDEVLIIHQDSFAADYQDEEYALFGMAIKLAELYGKEVRIINS